jgi:hypothetical protein
MARGRDVSEFYPDVVRNVIVRGRLHGVAAACNGQARRRSATS